MDEKTCSEFLMVNWNCRGNLFFWQKHLISLVVFRFDLSYILTDALKVFLYTCHEIVLVPILFSYLRCFICFLKIQRKHFSLTILFFFGQEQWWKSIMFVYQQGQNAFERQFEIEYCIVSRWHLKSYITMDYP